MNRGSKKVFSNQNGLHPDLEKHAVHYASSVYQRPIAEHTRKAFSQALDFLSCFSLPLILDSGCGTGDSSLFLARKYPNHPVLGVDKSEIRLSKKQHVPKNVLLVRAELLDFWKLIFENQIPVHYHALYYPNPWPKKTHFGRRFHGHPIFPLLLKISPHLELRTNWDIYAREFQKTCEILAPLLQIPAQISLSRFFPEVPETAFEKKYLENEHSLWRVIFLSLNSKLHFAE